jgi:hypothetical protein
VHDTATDAGVTPAPEVHDAGSATVRDVVDAGRATPARVVGVHESGDPRLNHVEHAGDAEPPKMSVLTSYARRALVDCSGDVATRLKIVAFADGHVEVSARPANECANEAIGKLTVPAFSGKPVAVELELNLADE